MRREGLVGEDARIDWMEWEGGLGVWMGEGDEG